MKIGGEEQRTVSDAAPLFSVSVKTLKQWIEKGIIPRPEKKEYGTREIEVYPDEYIEKAKRALDEYREKKKAERKKQKTRITTERQLDPINTPNL